MAIFSLPTKIIAGENCLAQHSAELAALGKKALIVTGKSSARNGSLQDVQQALTQEKIAYTVFDQITSNPSIELTRQAADVAKAHDVDFIIGLGGGSPLDSAKAVAILKTNDLDDTALFSGPYPQPFLPVVAIPTTSGTGSEVTQYSILSNSHLETKTSIAHPGIFPKLAFLDARYTLALPKHITINTAIDALSHAVEGYLSVKATEFSQIFAEKSLALLGESLPHLAGDLDLPLRDSLLQASTLAGIVIAHTGTTAVHSLGYSLTYFKNIDHGRANGLLLTAYLEFLSTEHLDKVNAILALLQLKNLDEFAALLQNLLGAAETITADEMALFSAKALKAPNINNTLTKPAAADLILMLQKSLTVSA